jgi:hypothetical protein
VGISVFVRVGSLGVDLWFLGGNSSSESSQLYINVYVLGVWVSVWKKNV